MSVADRGREHADARWEAFQSTSKMDNHWWWRPGWRVGRRLYTWHITFDKSLVVQEQAKAYQDAIHLDFLDPVPMSGLHLTMQGVGFTDEIDRSEVEALIDATRKECAALAPFQLCVGPAYADPEGVPLAIQPWKPVENTRLAVRRAIAHVRGVENVPEPLEGFSPHITLFYSNSSEADPASLRAALAPLRQMPPVQASVAAVSLIRLGRDEHEYEWTTEADVPLGSA